MELFTALIGLMDDTILAMLGVPVLNEMLIGSLMAACFGTFLMLRKAAGHRGMKK